MLAMVVREKKLCCSFGLVSSPTPWAITPDLDKYHSVPGTATAATGMAHNWAAT